MANISGTAANDTLVGTSADDLIQGLGGNDHLLGAAGDDQLEGGTGEDQLNGGEGNDVLLGGDDNDQVEDASSGNDVLQGGAGNDYLNVWRNIGVAASTVSMDGGSGNDSFGVYDQTRASTFNILGGEGNDRFWILGGAAAINLDAGAGDDLIELDGAVGAVSLALGIGGADRIRMIGHSFNATGGTVSVTGFDAGNGGDTLDLDEFLNRYLNNWDYRTNPFGSGHLRLVQSGADTLLQIDWNGGANTYVTFLTFANTDASSLTSYNFNGWPSDGTVAAGVNLVGDPFANDVLTGAAGNDYIQGLGGGDTIRGGAGDDRLEGGSEADIIYGGLGDDIIEGGGGDDYLIADLRGLDILRGGDGNDTLEFTSIGDNRGWLEFDGGIGDDYIYASVGYQPPSDAEPTVTRVRIIGGEGADRITISRVNEAEVNAGAGNDRIDLDTYTNARITLGSGSDLIRLSELNGFVFTGRMITITDFEGGSSGDRLDWSDYLAEALPGWDRTSNPFGTYLRLVQSGADTLVQISNSGNGDFHTFITLENVQASSLGQVNMGGFPPDGSPPAGATLIGTPNADQLTGEGGADIIYGLGQGDTLRGGAGDDILYGEEGNDYLYGELGSDRLEGGTGMDSLSDQSGGDDVMLGGAGRDSISVSRYDGPYSTLLLDGGTDDDYLSFGGFVTAQEVLATVTMIGGDGNDQVNVSVRANATVDAGPGNDKVFTVTDPGQYSITLGSGSDELQLWSWVAAIGTVVVTDFQAGDLGDRLDFDGWFSLRFSGWDSAVNPFTGGYARLVQSGGATLLQVDPDGGNNSYVTLLTLANVSLFSLTAVNLDGFDPFTRGTAGADTMTGTAGGDSLFGGAGNDVLRMEQGGEDKAGGGDGNDVLYFGAAFSAGDFADGGAGRDALVLQGNVNVTLTDSNLLGIESLSLQSGANANFGDTANNFYDFNVKTADGNVPAGQQLIVNAQSLRAGEDFTFDGSAEKDGKFLVYGGHGTDILKGGDGVDVFFFEGQRWTAGDRVDGGAGRDALVISGGNGVTSIAFAADSLVNIESISVNNLFATDPSQKPSYELVLHNGNVAPGGTLIVNGSSLPAGQFVSIDGRGVHNGSLTLFGGGGDDLLFGGSGHDVITAGEGADILFGGAGADALTGGAGADVFRYDAATDSAIGLNDLIGDFQTGLDKIDLSRIDANANVAGDQAFSWIGAGAFSGSAGELRVRDEGGYRYVEGDTNGDGLADFAIAFYQSAAPQVQGDFLL